MRALIDGDMVVYMACAADQVTVDLDGEGDETFVDLEEATRSAARMIRNWTKKAGASQPIVCFSGPGNWRKLIYPDYKANRDPGARPQTYWDVKEAIELEHETWEIPGLEADDLMGIGATREGTDFVIVSRDKDMKTIPARVFNPDHDKRPVKIRKGIADQMHLKQTMTGDTTDNYQGIPRVGEVKAQDILVNPRKLVRKERRITRGKRKGELEVKWVPGDRCSVWEAMCSHAEKAGMTPEELIVQAQICRILRTGEFNTDKRIVRLWTPDGRGKELHLE